MLRILLEAIAVLALLTGLCVATQHWDGAREAELSFGPDEPAHFVTGLMIHRYIADGFPGNPMRYAERYYVRYPKVAIGHWPPIFYGLEALWFFPFGTSTTSALQFQALITGVMALLVYLLARPVVGFWAFGLAAWLVVLRSTRFLSGAVMLEPLTVIWEIASVYCWMRYMETGLGRWAYAFAAMASAALMTRGDALFLALFPVFATLLAREWTLIWRWPTWLCAGMVGVLCGPWYALTFRMVHDGWSSSKPNLAFVQQALTEYLFLMPVPLVGAGAVLLAVWAMAVGRETMGRIPWSTWVGYVLAAIVFQCIIPASVEERRLSSLTPAFLVLAAYGAVTLQKHLSLLSRIPAGAVALVLVAAHIPVTSTPAKLRLGIKDAVAEIARRPELAGMNILVSSAIDGEGMLIAEVASREPAPSRYLIRGSKLLASSDWAGYKYRSLFATPDAMLEGLTKSPVQIVVTDTFADNTPNELTFEVHNGLLQKTIAAYPDRFRPLFAKPGPGGEIRAYVLDEGRKAPGIQMEIDLSPKLGRKVSD